MHDRVLLELVEAAVDAVPLAEHELESIDFFVKSVLVQHNILDVPREFDS